MRLDLLNASRALTAVVESQHAGDAAYYSSQLARYVRTVERVAYLRPAPCRILDIGSHYLHQGILLSELGYEVWGLDVGLFANAGFVQERASAFNVRNAATSSIEDGDFFPDQYATFDIVIFTEILEHITFNPVRFWKRVYELLSDGGLIYISTPNSLRPVALAKALKNIVGFRGLGIPVDDIFENVTYGHHWKEYSAWEIKRYFQKLSTDFDVKTGWYSSDIADGHWLKRGMKRVWSAVPFFRSDIEAIVELRRMDGFSARIPRLPMQEGANAVEKPPPVLRRQIVQPAAVDSCDAIVDTSTCIQLIE